MAGLQVLTNETAPPIPGERRSSCAGLGISRLQSLDCLRAIACLAVIYGHCPGKIGLPGGWITGEYGVSLFCVLSGFLITSILLGEEARKRSIDLLGFLQRRAVRIVPAYMLVLFLTIIFIKSGVLFGHNPSDVHLFFSKLIGLVTFTANEGGPFPLTHYWSVSIEEQFYCTLPIVLLICRTTKTRVATLAVVCVAIAFVFKSGELGNVAFFPLSLGTLLALTNGKISQPNLNPWITLGAAFFAVALVVLTATPSLSPYGPIASSAFAFLVWSAARQQIPIVVLKPLAYVGRISYSIYLSHWTLLIFTDYALRKIGLGDSSLCQFALASAASIAFASVSWHYFEEPILRCKNRLGRRFWGVLVALTSPALLAAGVICHALFHV